MRTLVLLMAALFLAAGLASAPAQAIGVQKEMNPRSFSQLITSFIGSQCQGIHPALLMLDLYSWSAAIIALMTGFCVLCFKSN